MEELQAQIKYLQERFQKIKSQFDLDQLRKEIRELEVKMEKPLFWQEVDSAKKVSQELSYKQKLLTNLLELESKIQVVSELSTESTMQEDLNTEASQIAKQLDEIEFQLYLSGPHDSSEAILSVHAGTGGVEAMDWAAMLARMYQRFFEKQGWNYEISDESLGEEAGYKQSLRTKVLKSISMIVHAPLSYGYLKKEAGTHRLVRLSPFNADNLRQTSFALVEVLPVIEEGEEIQINPAELEFEAFRAGGHGGQNVNKVSTAVRIKHIPTGITVTAQTERSQLQNRENALALLRAKLWALQQTEVRETTEQLKGEVRQASWGTQIRSYVLHPYHMVKDLRTEVETSDTESVLNGNLDQFIEAEIRLDK